MTKTKLTLSLISLGILLLPVAALAQMNGTATGGYANASLTSLSDLVNAIEKAAGLVFGCIAVICFVIAGVLFLTAGGQAEKISAARSAFLWGVAGVVVGIIAFSIIAIVGSMMTA
ncbi:MAG: hypothetical protein ABSA74_02955 [Candidatus Staskawiczbacteria bacterium]|jgi:hypothetical protein